MKITELKLDGVQVNHRGDWVFVQVETDEGLTGLGELKAGRNYANQVAATRELGNQLKGRDPLGIGKIFAEFKSDDKVKIQALSAVDQALWDILGQSLNAPIHRLLGGAVRQEVRLYANINRATTERTPNGFAKNAAAAVDDGFDAVKLAPFDGMSRGINTAQEARAGIACLEAVREAIGPETDLLVDCHSRLSVQGALEVADAIRDLNMFWFEQPVPETDMEGCVKVKEECGLRIAGCEGRMLREGFAEVFEHQSMHVVMPDVKIVGGLGELKRVGDIASAWDIPTGPHGASGPVTVAAGMQAMLTLPEFLILEYAWGEASWRNDLLEPAVKVENGRIRLVDRPGLGYKLNKEVLDEHRISLN